MNSVSQEIVSAITNEIAAGGKLLHVSRKYQVCPVEVRKILSAHHINYRELRRSRMAAENSYYFRMRYASLEERPVPSRDELLGELKKMVVQLCRLPSAREMKKHFGRGYSDYLREFGSWKNLYEDPAIKAYVMETKAGLSAEQRKQRLIDYLRAVNEERGYPPGKEELLNHPAYNYMKYHRAFGGLREAIKAAGLNPVANYSEYTATMKEVHKSLKELAVTLQGISFEKNAAEQAAFLINRAAGNLENLMKRANELKYRDPSGIEQGRENSSAPPAGINTETNSSII